MDYSMESVFQTLEDWCTQELTETMVACTGNVQVQDRWGLSETGRKTWSPNPKPRRCLYWHLLIKEKNSLLQWSVTGYQNHTQGHTPCPAIDGQLKTNLMVFSDFFWSHYALSEISFIFVIYHGFQFCVFTECACVCVSCTFFSFVLLFYFDLIFNCLFIF